MIIANENADPEPMNSWFSDADVRNDALLIKELLAFIAEHSTESVIMADGIIACPNQVRYRLSRRRGLPGVYVLERTNPVDR